MYTELHVHTAYSFLDGASLPEEMVGRAAELGYRALAITDHDGVHGAMEFAQLARAAGITPITGAEVTLADRSHLTLLAESPTGYGNLCRLLTHLHHGRPIAAVEVDSPHPPASSPKSRGGGAGAPPIPLSQNWERGGAQRRGEGLPPQEPSSSRLNRVLRKTAGLHLRFGLLATAGLLLAAVLERWS